MASIVTGVNTANGYFENLELPPEGAYSLEILFTMPQTLPTAGVTGVFALGANSSSGTSAGAYTSSGNLNVRASSTLSLSRTPTAGAQYHLVITVDGTAVTIMYGDESTTNSRTMGVPLANAVRIGRYISYDGFNGSIQLVRIYNRVLTRAEVTARYNGGKPEAWVEPDDSGCIAEFRAFTATADTWEESRSNGLQLTAVGTVALETVEAKTAAIPWNDGTGDNITVTYTGVEGEGPILVASDPNLSGASRAKVVNLKDSDRVARATISVSQNLRTRAYSAAYSKSYK